MLSLNCRNIKEYTRKDTVFGHVSVCFWHQTLHLNRENGGYAWVALSLHGKDTGYCQEQSCKDVDCINIEHPDGLSDGTMPDDACNRSRRHLLPFSQGHSQKKQIGTSAEDSLWFTGMVANDPRILLLISCIRFRLWMITPISHTMPRYETKCTTVVRIPSTCGDVSLN